MSRTTDGAADTKWETVGDWTANTHGGRKGAQRGGMLIPSQSLAWTVSSDRPRASRASQQMQA